MLWLMWKRRYIQEIYSGEIDNHYVHQDSMLMNKGMTTRSRENSSLKENFRAPFGDHTDWEINLEIIRRTINSWLTDQGKGVEQTKWKAKGNLLIYV